MAIVCRYLTWLGINTKVFNVGNYRRNLFGAEQDHTFFDPNNPVGIKHRTQAAKAALEDMIRWFNEDDGIVAIYDATNSTVERRQLIYDRLTQDHIQPFFIESICDDERIILENIREVKLSSPDYLHVDAETAAKDFMARIEQYKTMYTTIQQPQESHYTFIKMINVGSQVIINMIRGYLESRIVYYLMNLHTTPRKIYMSRHGESMYNVEGKIGGDSALSPRGVMYAEKLPQLIKDNLGDQQDLIVWTSTMKRTIQTGSFLEYPKFHRKALDELDAGVCDGMTYEEIEEQFPEDYANRDEDKFNYRYRGGESYRDVVLRLEPIIMDLERQKNILIIGHQAILRCIYAYFMNYNQEDLPYINIPLHTVIELTPRAYGCAEKKYKGMYLYAGNNNRFTNLMYIIVDIEAVDTHRPKPSLKKKPSRIDLSSAKLGASGEIVTDLKSPILPINPQIWASNIKHSSKSSDLK